MRGRGLSVLTVWCLMALGCSGGKGDESDDSRQDASSARASPDTHIPSAEQISAALADAGVFVDDGGVTIGDTRVGIGADGVTIDDASLVSLTDGGVVLGSGDGSITIRTQGTCAELLECCESLSDESERSNCMTMHDQLQGIPLGAGDLLCAQLVPSLCP